MKEAMSYAAGMDVRLIPYEKAEGMEKTREMISSLKPGQDIAVFIGPEGGFEEDEVEMAADSAYGDRRACHAGMDGVSAGGKQHIV